MISHVLHTDVLTSDLVVGDILLEDGDMLTIREVIPPTEANAVVFTLRFTRLGSDHLGIRYAGARAIFASVAKVATVDEVARVTAAFTS